MAKVRCGLLCAQQVDAKLRHQSLEPRDFRETCGDIFPKASIQRFTGCEVETLLSQQRTDAAAFQAADHRGISLHLGAESRQPCALFVKGRVCSLELSRR